jgi:hypothetical protein
MQAELEKRQRSDVREMAPVVVRKTERCERDADIEIREHSEQPGVPHRH